jgi:YgiT-type zinc finger domain-containing protein
VHDEDEVAARMRQVIVLPRKMACDNCRGRTKMEFDRVDVGLADGRILHLSAVPYFQCQECDHRQMDPACKMRLNDGLDPFVAEAGAGGRELFATLQWREVLALDTSDSGRQQDRLFEVEWSVE